MAEHTVTLLDGFKSAGQTHHDVVLRELSTGDILDAQSESERPIATPDGYQLASSPALVGLNILRRQIERVGDRKGPLLLDEMRELSSRDLGLLNAAAETLDAATLREVSERGRSEPGSDET